MRDRSCLVANTMLFGKRNFILKPIFLQRNMQHFDLVIRGKSATWGVLRSRADIGGMAGLLVAPEARNTAQVIPGPVSGNGRVSGNANDPDIRA